MKYLQIITLICFWMSNDLDFGKVQAKPVASRLDNSQVHLYKRAGPAAVAVMAADQANKAIASVGEVMVSGAQNKLVREQSNTALGEYNKANNVQKQDVSFNMGNQLLNTQLGYRTLDENHRTSLKTADRSSQSSLYGKVLEETRQSSAPLSAPFTPPIAPPTAQYRQWYPYANAAQPAVSYPQRFSPIFHGHRQIPSMQYTAYPSTLSS